MQGADDGAAARWAPRQGPADIQAYYRDPAVVAEYLARRTAQPLNGMLHRQQVRFLNRVLGERRPQRVLEVAPGPARLTAELDHGGCGIAVDGSAEMLAVARDRLRASRGTWLVVRGDAFALPVPDSSVDLALAIRFVRRFAPDVRRRLYAEMRRTLTPGGALVIDAQNRAISLPHRLGKGLDRYPVFDALYDREELIAEIEGAGFRVRRLEGMVRHFALQTRLNRLRRHGQGLTAVARGMIGLVECLPSRAPSTWMLLAEVRP